MAEVRLEGLVKGFGDVYAVRNVTLHVREKEFLCILGPSGCGKTTTLRMIAGFEKPDSGRIWIGGRDVTRVPPYHRGAGMVFQSYALFPHMTVERNVAFGLRMRRVSEKETQQRIHEVLALVDLSDKIHRYPRELSGGEQQRVALARVLAIRPSVILFDEPLSNLDAKLRKEMRFEIRRLQQEAETTAVYVTHDQEEAMGMADTIVVMQGGQIEQAGSPDEVYDRPRTKFVAEFIGGSNVFDMTIERLEGDYVFGTTDSGVPIKARTRTELGDDAIRAGARLAVAIKPERIRLTNGAVANRNRPNSCQVELNTQARIGPWVHSLVSLSNSGWSLTVHTPSQLLSGIEQPGAIVYAEWDEDDCVLIRP